MFPQHIEHMTYFAPELSAESMYVTVHRAPAPLTLPKEIVPSHFKCHPELLFRLPLPYDTLPHAILYLLMDGSRPVGPDLQPCTHLPSSVSIEAS